RQRLAEAIAGRQRLELAELDGLQGALVGLAQPRVGVGPTGGVEVEVERTVELFASAGEVPGPALLDPPGQSGIGRSDQAADGVFRSPGGVAGRSAQRAAARAARGQGADGDEEHPLPWPGHYRPLRTWSKNKFWILACREEHATRPGKEFQRRAPTTCIPSG